MTRTFYYIATLILSFIAFQSCTSTTFEIKDINVLGADGNQAFIGQTLDIEAVIDLTENLTDVDITVEPVSEKGWQFQEHFEENLDKGRSVLVKKQIHIPDTASTGKYMVTLVAVQEDEQRARQQLEVDFVIDSTVPILSPLDIGLNKAGNDLHLETEVTAAKKVAKIDVLVEGEDWQQSFNFSGAKVEGKLSVHFHEHLHVEDAPAGVYHVIVRVEDEQGRTGTVTGSFEKH